MNDLPEPEKCLVCGQARTAAMVGSMTQWISSCACEEYDERERFAKSVRICSFCHRKIDTGRSGSLTQWVFQSDACDCDRQAPRTKVREKVQVKFKQSSFEGFRDSGEDEKELELDPDQFPIERYKPVAKMGEGTTGTVYFCRDKLLKKRVAVKVLKSLTDEQMMSFQNEARTTAKLDHPSIVKVLDFGATAKTVPYMVMEYLDGITLKKYIKDSGPLNPGVAIDLFIKIADALENAHGHGIFHRDLQSNNIIVLRMETDTADARLVDFGLAKIREVNQEPTIYNGNTIVGTPFYMSPDQANGLPYDKRSEIYSLGCVMFEALSGTVPFVGATAIETIRMHASEEIPSLVECLKESDSALKRLDKIIRTCLEKNPEKRYCDMGTLRRDLEALRVQLSEESKVQTDAIPSLFLSNAFIPKPANERKVRFRMIAVLGIVFLTAIYIAVSWCLESLRNDEQQARDSRVEFNDDNRLYYDATTRRINRLSKPSQSE